MSVPDIAVIIVVSLAVTGAVIYLFIRKKKKGTACPGCTDCPYKKQCGKKDKTDE